MNLISYRILLNRKYILFVKGKETNKTKESVLDFKHTQLQDKSFKDIIGKTLIIEQF